MPIDPIAAYPPIPSTASHFVQYLMACIPDHERRDRVIARVDEIMRSKAWPYRVDGPDIVAVAARREALELSVKDAITQAVGGKVDSVVWVSPRDTDRTPTWMTMGFEPGRFFKAALDRATRGTFEHHLHGRFSGYRGLSDARAEVSDPFIETYHRDRLPDDPALSHAHIARAQVVLWYVALHIGGHTLEADTLEPLLDVFRQVAPISQAFHDPKIWIVQAA